NISNAEVESKLEAVRGLWQRFVYRDAILLEARRQTKDWNHYQDWAQQYETLLEDDVFATVIQALHYKLHNDPWRAKLPKREWGIPPSCGINRARGGERWQLGYTGVEIPHIVKAVMREECRLAALPESPTRSHSGSTRESESWSWIKCELAALNPSNPVIQFYDMVAVQPMNQQAFAQACTTMELEEVVFEDQIFSLDI
ncbi:glycosyltransferase-like protein, partial [Selaginella moellendorffii]